MKSSYLVHAWHATRENTHAWRAGVVSLAKKRERSTPPGASGPAQAMGGGKGGACVMPARKAAGRTTSVERAPVCASNAVTAEGTLQCAQQPATQQLAPQLECEP
ncbi:hypothetical protein [Paraburkholderia ferrariae]|uniref:ESPR domain-containing protein n=1 Tax=Paraburkholderia ferrariae TaxID=386056 RepID=A0ABU9RVH7_9BURK